MYKYIPSQDHLVAFEFMGSIIRDDVDTYYRTLSAALDQYNEVGIYLDMSAVSDDSAACFAKRVKADLMFFLRSDQVSRLAIICDASLVGGFTAFASHICRPEIAFFNAPEQDLALGWAGTLSDRNRPYRPLPQAATHAAASDV